MELVREGKGIRVYLCSEIENERNLWGVVFLPGRLLFLFLSWYFPEKKQQTSLPGFYVKTVRKTGKFSSFLWVCLSLHAWIFLSFSCYKGEVEIGKSCWKLLLIQCVSADLLSVKMEEHENNSEESSENSVWCVSVSTVLPRVTWDLWKFSAPTTACLESVWWEMESFPSFFTPSFSPSKLVSPTAY